MRHDQAIYSYCPSPKQKGETDKMQWQHAWHSFLQERTARVSVYLQRIYAYCTGQSKAASEFFLHVRPLLMITLHNSIICVINGQSESTSANGMLHGVIIHY